MDHAAALPPRPIVLPPYTAGGRASSPIFTFASSASPLPPSSSFPPSGALPSHPSNLLDPMPRSSSYSQSTNSTPSSPSCTFHSPSTLSPSCHPFPSPTANPLFPSPIRPVDSTGRPRFRPYDDPARQASARRSRLHLFLAHHAVCVVCSVMAIALYRESTAEAQDDAYFTFFTALSVLTIGTAAIEGVRMAAERWRKKPQTQSHTATQKAPARGQPSPAGGATQVNQRQGGSAGAAPPSAPPDSLTIDIPSPHRSFNPTAAPASPAASTAAATAPAPTAAAPIERQSLLSRLAAALPLSRVMSSLQLLHLVLFIGIFILSLVSLLVQSVYWHASDLDLAILHRAGHLKVWLIILSALCAVCSGAICVLALDRQWPMPSSWARSLLFLIALLLVSLGLAVVLLNERITNDASDRGHIPQWSFRSMQWIGAVCLFVGVHAASISFTVLQDNRERRMFGVLVGTYSLVCLVACAVSLAFTASLLTYYAGAATISSAHINALVNADPILALLLCLLSLASVAVARHLVAPPSSNLRVERFDLSTAPPELLAHWANSIDRHSTDEAALTGAAQLELMALYCKNSLPSVYCICLRVRRPERGGGKKGGGGGGVGGEKGGERVRIVHRLEEVGAEFDCEEADAVTMEREREVKSRAALVATS